MCPRAKSYIITTSFRLVINQLSMKATGWLIYNIVVIHKNLEHVQWTFDCAVKTNSILYVCFFCYRRSEMIKSIIYFNNFRK
jgi:hypothetical protein